MFPTRRIITSGGDVYRDEYSLDFDGTNDYLFVPDKVIDVTANFTISMWIKFHDADPSTHNSIIDLGTDDDNHFALIIAGNLLKWSLQVGGVLQRKRSSDVSFSNNIWYNIVFTVVSAAATCYVNGVEIDVTVTQEDSPDDMDGADNTCYIGTVGGGATRFFDGQISEIVVWNTSFSLSQAKTIYNGGEPFDARNVALSNLSYYWRMGDGEGDVKGLAGLINDVTPSSTLGAELITNGGFADGTNWSIESGSPTWTIGGGVASANEGDAMHIVMDEGILTQDKIYRVQYEISNYSSGTLNTSSDNGTLTGPNRTANGVYVEYVQITANDLLYFISAELDGDLDNVSIKEVTGTPALMNNFTVASFSGDVPG